MGQMKNTARSHYNLDHFAKYYCEDKRNHEKCADKFLLFTQFFISLPRVYDNRAQSGNYECAAISFYLLVDTNMDLPRSRKWKIFCDSYSHRSLSHSIDRCNLSSSFSYFIILLQHFLVFHTNHIQILHFTF